MLPLRDHGNKRFDGAGGIEPARPAERGYPARFPTVKTLTIHAQNLRDLAAKSRGAAGDPAAPLLSCVAQLVARRRRRPPATSSTEPRPSPTMPVISIAATLAPVIGRELGVWTTFSPCTVGFGFRVSFSPRTQVPSAPACWPCGQVDGGGVWQVPLTIV